MTEKLIQLRLEGEIKNKVDQIFNEQGLTTQTAIKMFLTQVASSGQSPFDDLFHPVKH